MRDLPSRSLLAALLFGLAAGGCADTGASGDCADGIDNDGDGLIDENDPGCLLNGDTEAPDPDLAACEDGVDNDDDGLIDFPADPGCAGPGDDDEFDEGAPACRDGIDNDGDGLIDFPNDPGCGLSLEDDESDDCPDGPSCPSCANGVDDDGDGKTDYPDDPGCDSAFDDDEFNAVVNECGAQVEIRNLVLPDEATGTLVAGGNNELISACGGSGQEIVFRVEVTEPTALFVTTDFPETTVDTVVYVRSECRDTDTEVGCDDDGGAGLSSELVASVDAGTHYVVVDAHNSGSGGDFRVRIEGFTPQGESCDPADPQCAPGLVCRLLDDSATMETCELPSCMDGIDNDSDGLADFPEDPGCTSETDNDETDDCPDGPGCPQCSNGVDDDSDGETDYPEDDGCVSASDNVELDNCAPGVPIEPLPETGATGTTGGASSFVGSCGFGSYPEDVYAFDVGLDLVSLTFSTVGSTLDTVTYVRFGTCSDAMDEIACEDPGTGGEAVTIPNPAQGTYFVFVDGDFGSGDYVLNVSGIIAAGDTCDPSSTALVCESGYYCDGTSNTCLQAACADGDDNDGDGLADFPADPGCASLSDNDETDDCPDGPSCPACANDMDDDGDGLMDHPDDPGCAFPSDDDEEDCPGETDPVDLLTMPTVAGTTAGLTDDFTAACATSSAPDKVYVLPVPSFLNSLRVDTIGSTLDTILTIKAPTCADPDIACNDEGDGPFGSSTIELTDVAAGSYQIIVDGWSSNEGDFTLNVSGEIRAGEVCDPAQEASGMFVCEPGYACDGSVCALAACNDGMDNDADGLADYPADPGCLSPSTNDETDDCPDGGMCPACANEIDDDGDGLMDYPDDPGCIAAGDDNEIDECIPGVEVMILDDAGTTGTTPPSGDGSNFTPSCHTSTLSTEDVYAYFQNRDLTEITFSTVGSTGDNVLSVRTGGDCGDAGTEVACENTVDLGETITLTNPAQGSYYVFVDGDFISQIDYVLDVSGIIASGGACDPAVTNFPCETGTICSGGVCTPSACNDGMDNDGDGLADFPADPGCSSVVDDDEFDDCGDANPTACPECADGIDNDGDGDIDYPDDAECQGVWDTAELTCNDTDPVLPFLMSPEMGDTSVATDDFVPACSTTSTAPDVAYTLVVPGMMNSLTIDTLGSAYDTVLSLRSGSCGGSLIACNDNEAGGSNQSMIQLANVSAGAYAILVDGFMSASGAFTLSISGEIASGEPCDPAQTYFTCEGAETCTDTGGGNYMCQ